MMCLFSLRKGEMQALRVCDVKTRVVDIPQPGGGVRRRSITVCSVPDGKTGARRFGIDEALASTTVGRLALSLVTDASEDGGPASLLLESPDARGAKRPAPTNVAVLLEEIFAKLRLTRAASFSTHSCRKTLPSAAAALGASEAEVEVIGGWKTSGSKSIPRYVKSTALAPLWQLLRQEEIASTMHRPPRWVLGSGGSRPVKCERPQGLP
eukprot:gnl/Ergobibamus_cyprinoides/304.p2 GENE.gnl/Ergobibamus_cyprinoides/304~~gnl/Ergobibamus_cyprinoides/304.p2  ORF type:complete len:210 (+),score=17.78 gnl/Ergobibamus_cyprinoides/304:924-1553(+)